jgi:hypothetical protein
LILLLYFIYNNFPSSLSFINEIYNFSIDLFVLSRRFTYFSSLAFYTIIYLVQSHVVYIYHYHGSSFHLFFHKAHDNILHTIFYSISEGFKVCTLPWFITFKWKLLQFNEILAESPLNLNKPKCRHQQFTNIPNQSMVLPSWTFTITLLVMNRIQQ